MGTTRSLLLVAALVTLACSPSAITPEPPVRTIAYDSIPWCADSSGHSPVYPCRWDARERLPSPAWDRSATRIAIWVPREVGCAALFASVRTPEVTPAVAWSCYYAPEPEPS